MVIPLCLAEDISGRIRLAECSVCIAGKNCRYSASWLTRTSAATSTAKPTAAFRTNSLSPVSATPAAAAPPRRPPLPPKAKPNGPSPAFRPSRRCCRKAPSGATFAGSFPSDSSLRRSSATTFCPTPAFASNRADFPFRRPPCGSPRSRPGRSPPTRTFCLRRRSCRRLWPAPPTPRRRLMERMPLSSLCSLWRHLLARLPWNFAAPPGPFTAASSS